MTYLELQQLCQRQSGNKSPDALIGFQSYLNFGQNDLAIQLGNVEELHASDTLSFSQGTESASLATDFLVMRNEPYISFPTDYEKVLTRINYNKLRALYGTTSDDSQSTPIYWYYTPTGENALSVFPVPEQTYTISYDYLKKPDAMTAPADEPFFPSPYHYLLVDFALAMYYESPSQRAFDRAAYYSTKWNQEDVPKIRTAFGALKGRSQVLTQINYGTGVNE